MAKTKILSVTLLALAITACTSTSHRGVHESSALELATRAERLGTSPTRCNGAQRTAVCSSDRTCRCTDSNALLQTLGLDEAVWQGQ